jgi:hypothetical protein
MIKKFDVAVYELVHMLADGGLRRGVVVLGLAENAVGYSTTGGHLSLDTVAALERYRQEIIAGTRVVPSAPNGYLEPPRGVAPTTTLTVTFDGAACQYDGPGELRPGTVGLDFVNTSDVDGSVDVLSRGELAVQVPASAATSNSGYAGLEAATDYAFVCHSVSGSTVDGPTVEVGFA